MPTQIDLIKKYDLILRGRLGQHILIDPNIQRKIVDLLGLRAGDRVLEIGPGLGALTAEMLGRGAEIWAIEKEEKFVGILEREYVPGAEGRLHLIQGDILEMDLAKILPRRGRPGPGFTVVGNLPYYITAPILFHLVDHRSLIREAVVMVQKEVASRIVAGPGTKDYGRLSLTLRYFADVRIAFSVPPTCFTPAPEVDSSVIVLTFRRKTGGEQPVDERLLFHLIQLAFGKRRKTLLHLLSQDRGLKVTRGRLERIFEECGWPKTVRGEELLLKDFIALSESLQTRRRVL